MLWVIIVIAALGIFALIGNAIMKADNSSGESDNNTGEKEKIMPKSDETDVHSNSNSNKNIPAPRDTLVNDEEEENKKLSGFEVYVQKNKVSLDNYDVQYDMTNNLDKQFKIVGMAELHNYYNYGYRDLEGDCFCVRVTPQDKKYSSSWYIYCDRDAFKQFFAKLKGGKCYVEMVAVILSSLYESHQGNCAMLTYVSWDKD